VDLRLHPAHMGQQAYCCDNLKTIYENENTAKKKLSVSFIDFGSASGIVRFVQEGALSAEQ
jgi:hypothetical protein